MPRKPPGIFGLNMFDVGLIFEAFSDVSLERLVLAFLVRFPAWFRLSFRFSFEAFEKGANAWYTVKIYCFPYFTRFTKELA